MNNASNEQQQQRASGDESVRIEIGGELIDLTRYPPLTQGDKRRLRNEHNLDFVKFALFTPDEESTFALYVLRRVRPATTMEEVDALPAKTLMELLLYVLQRSGEVESPFSKRSTSSDGTTVGA